MPRSATPPRASSPTSRGQRRGRDRRLRRRRRARDLGLQRGAARGRAARCGRAAARRAEAWHRGACRGWQHRPLRERPRGRDLPALAGRRLPHQRGPPSHRWQERGCRSRPRRTARLAPDGGRDRARPCLHDRLRRRRRQDHAPEDRRGLARGVLRRIEAGHDRSGLPRRGVELLMDARFVRAIRAELRDRRGTVLGALTLAGLLAVGAPVVLALIGALAVFGLRLVLAVVPAVRRAPRRAHEWSVRAEIAVRSLRQLSRRAKPGPVAERCRSIADGASETPGQLAQLPAPDATAGALLTDLERVPLAEERGALERELRTATSLDRADLARSLAAVDRQAAGGGPLLAAPRGLAPRVRTVAIGLEGLGAQLAQVLALTGGIGAPGDRRPPPRRELQAPPAGPAGARGHGRLTIASIARPHEEVRT